jgi:hypothetical protein
MLQAGRMTVRVWYRALATIMALTAGGQASAAEKWRSIFDGKTLDGWTPKIVGYAAGDNFAQTFSVRDGAIRVSYAGYDRFNFRFGHLFYRVPLKSYRLRLKYRIIEGGEVEGAPKWSRSNSGVMFYAQSPQSMAREQWFPASVEFQLLGREGRDNTLEPTGSVCTPGTNITIDGGRLKTHCATSIGPVVPNDSWTDLELEVRANGQVIHRINGVEVLRYNGVELDLADLTAEPLIAAQNGSLTLSSGYIALQSEGQPVEFKDIAVLETL